MRSLIILSIMAIGIMSAGTASADNVPKDFRVKLYDGGGMVRQGANYFISKDSSFAEMWEGEARTKLYFKTSMDDLKSLYNTILQNDFHRIETFEEMVYDRGGTTITATYDGDTYSKADAGMTFIEESWQEAFNMVEGEIRKIVAKNLVPMQRQISIKFDDSFMDEDKIVNFNIGDFVYMSAKDGYNGSVMVTLLPGEHYAYFTMMNKELTTEPGAKIFAQGQGVVSIGKDTDEILVYRVGKEILWK